MPLEIKPPLTNAPELYSLADLSGEWRICAYIRGDQTWAPTCSEEDYQFVRARLWADRFNVPPLSAVRGHVRDEFGARLALYVRVHPHYRGSENQR